MGVSFGFELPAQERYLVAQVLDYLARPGRLGELSGEIYREEQDAWIDTMVKEMFLEELKEELAEEFKEVFELDVSSVRESIEKKFENDRALSWRNALKKRFAELQEEHDDALREAVRMKVRGPPGGRGTSGDRTNYF